jgi:hypothetical protein
MNTRVFAMLYHVRYAWHVAAAVLMLLAGTHSALAQWTVGNVANAWSAYNSQYLYSSPSSAYEHFATTIGGSTPDTFWQSAEEIDMADDGGYWSAANDTSIHTSVVNEVTGLVNGFRNIHGDTWTSDTYNDDILVAVIAFARGSQVVGGNSLMLTDAENNFTAVWNRAQAGDGGLCENTGGGVGCYENSSANWTFVIAGRILYALTGTTSYKTEADGVYSWALSHLYISTSGGVADGSGGSASYYSYNYGYAIGAATYEGDSDTATGATYFLMHDFNNYAGTYNGYNVLPNYGQGATDNDGGFNGITLRWTSFASVENMIPSLGGYLDWAQANVSSAWANRSSTELMWDDWVSPTQNSEAYSWDCSSAMAGMFSVPAP